MLICGYGMALLGLWGFLDKSAMRLRTGYAEDDILNEDEVGKLGIFFLVLVAVVVGHSFFTRFEFGGDAEALTPMISPVNTPFESPIVHD